MPTTHIKFYSLPVCPKCKIMKARLQKIQESHPDVTLEELGLQAYIGEALKKRIMKAPIIRINNKTYSGIIDEETILASL